MTDTVKSMTNTVKTIYDDVVEFQSSGVSGLTLAAFATIFTWGLVQSLKKTVLTPLISSVIPSADAKQELKYPLKRNQTLFLGEFLAELIEWAILILILFIIWKWKFRKTTTDGKK